MASEQFRPGSRPEAERGRRPGPDQRAADRSPWNWLLLVPLVLCMLTPLFNRKGPKFLDFPAFYWLQLLFVVVGVVSTGTVYLMTRTKGDE